MAEIVMSKRVIKYTLFIVNWIYFKNGVDIFKIIEGIFWNDKLKSIYKKVYTFIFNIIYYIKWLYG